MDTYTPDRNEEDWDTTQREPEAAPPRRARRQYLNRRTAALGALVTCAIGFYAGIRVEKSQLSSSTTSLGSGAATGARAAARAGGFAGFAGRGTTGSGAGAATGAGPAAGFAGAGAGGAGVSLGTVSSVNGKTLYVTDTSGNTVKVKLSSSTKITKTQSVGRKAIRPGDTILVTGAQGAGDATTAASVTDSGNRSGGSGASGSGAGGSGAGGSGSGGKGGGSGSGSAVGSLFSSGG